MTETQIDRIARVPQLASPSECDGQLSWMIALSEYALCIVGF